MGEKMTHRNINLHRPHISKRMKQRPPLLNGRTPRFVLLKVSAKGLHHLGEPAKVRFPERRGRRIRWSIVVFAARATVVYEADGCIAFVPVVGPCIAEGTVDVCVEDVVSL